MGIWERIFGGKHIPKDFHEFSDPELRDAERALDGIEDELNHIESIANFFEKQLDIAPKINPGTRPSYIGIPLPHYLKSELKKMRIQKPHEEWTIYYFTLTDFARLKELVEYDWFDSIDDQIAAPFEAITRGLYKTRKIYKREKLLRMLLGGNFKIDERRKKDIVRFAQILNRRNELQQRCNKIIKQIGEGKLNTLLIKPIFVKNIKKRQKILEDRFNH